MDDDYVKVFMWRGDVASLPEPAVLIRESVQSSAGLTRALNPAQIATYFLERYAGVLVDVGWQKYLNTPGFLITALRLVTMKTSVDQAGKPFG